MTPPKGRITRNPLFDTVEPTRPTAVPELDAMDKDGVYRTTAAPPPSQPSKPKATQVYLDAAHEDFLLRYRMAALHRGIRNPSASKVVRHALDQLAVRVSPEQLAELEANGLL